MTGAGGLDRDAIYWHYPHYNRHPQSFPSGVIRAGDWKLVGHGDPANLKDWELYNLANDRTEIHNLAAASPQRVERMARAWQDWAKRTGLKR